MMTVMSMLTTVREADVTDHQAENDPDNHAALTTRLRKILTTNAVNDVD